MAEEQGNSGDLWPPPAPDSPATRRRRPPPERHAHWIDHENRADEPREDAPRLLWWILGALLIFGVFSVLIRMFLVL
ncbi:MAG: hypothetical protein F4038_00815 [Chloroflexi bacterium]|nr:hypothetical protein [Chloroflexota bacterium]MYD53906.1 hypothetical protein [Chloroflexota bacterium]MYG90437.1 hypothetical protein [Chloroflexota bacterium]MYJ91579.1 hypothetical protein [Chloroflexota bacterium]